MNKSSTVMQVGFEKNSDGSDSNIIRLKFLKCRSTERHEPIHVVFDKATKQLVEADSDSVGGLFLYSYFLKTAFLLPHNFLQTIFVR